MDDTLKEIKKELADFEKRMTVMETLLTGAGDDRGLIGGVKELRDGQKSLLKFQYLFMGAMIVINILVPLVLKNMSL